MPTRFVDGRPIWVSRDVAARLDAGEPANRIGDQVVFGPLAGVTLRAASVALPIPTAAPARARCPQCANMRVICTACAQCTNSCCSCFRSHCSTCGVNGLACTSCRGCQQHCTCTEAASVNTLRRRAQQARWTAGRARHLAEERERIAMRSRSNEQTVFLPAGTGKDLVLPLATSQFLSASLITSLYGKMPEQVGKEWVIKNVPFMFKELRTRRYVVPEIEVSSGDRASIQALVQPWLGNCVRDGSLPETGFEINLTPAQGDTYVQMIRSICAGLALGNAKINDKCGLHVHADARDLDYMDIRKLVLLYELIEPAFFCLFPKKRWSNHYCQPCGYSYATHIRNDEALGLDDPKGLKDPNKKKPDLKKAIVESVFGEGGKPNTRSKYGDGQAHNVRYRQLNLYSYYYRGSVEFRGSPGSIDSEYIIPYSAVCAGLLDFAKGISERNITSLSPYLSDLVKDNKVDLFKQALGGLAPSNEVAQRVLNESIRVLKDTCQDTYIGFIDKLCEANRPKEADKKAGKEKVQADDIFDIEIGEEEEGF